MQNSCLLTSEGHLYQRGGDRFTGGGWEMFNDGVGVNITDEVGIDSSHWDVTDSFDITEGIPSTVRSVTIKRVLNGHGGVKRR